MQETIYDLIIVGAGPAGLAASIYSGREDIKTLLIDKDVVGGLAAITDNIDNYPGFEDGISGYELSQRLEKQSRRFGTEIQTGVEAKSVKKEGKIVVVSTNKGEFRSKALLISTGTTYKHLDIPGEAEQIGRGVHFCATCDGPLYKNKTLVVIGGGNSAVQETLFLARFASKITILVRGDKLKASAVLIDELDELANVEVVFNSPATRIINKKNRVSGVESNSKVYPCDGVFVFVGLLANTEAFIDTTEHDENNYLITDKTFKTNVSGVFVAGDVRSGSTWQIASAIGEGVDAALCISEYLTGLKRT